ncbi:nucleoside recognition domain-containing protein [Paenibacillus sp. YN15]|uniref:nucleoside recognition domain-containing protein n=1 Tax=Paenibacillus sp. YN15 TaxID=1742774 RepID=UPI0015EBDF91|nr:nucleoside recognition domain-containing protein [Paenibacillus sp. YN15]
MRRLIPWNPLVAAALFILPFLAMLLAYPNEVISASMRGILIWWDVLFPSLFPFLVLAELMLGFGIVHFFGSLLDPLMRPLFRVPGIGGFVVTMGFASGYPMTAKLTAKLWEDKLINREEGERLVAFATTSDPIFLIGAVSVGFFHDARLAVVLGAAHYGTAVLLGLLMRFHSGGRMSPPAPVQGKGRLVARSFRAMHEARMMDGRPFGVMLQQAIRSAIQLIFVIGGLVVFASTILEVLTIAQILGFIQDTFGGLLGLAGVPRELAQSLVDGSFEVTLGTKAAGGASASIPLVYKAACGAFVLAWAGLSVHAQIISLVHKTDLRYGPFLLARLAHGLLSFGAVLLLWNRLKPEPAPAFALLASPGAASWLRPGLWPGMVWQAGYAVAGGLLLYLLAAGIIRRRFAPGGRSSR